MATGGTPGIFEGNYRVAYFTASGDVKAEFDLEITRHGRTFDLTWSKNGEIHLFGVGFEQGDGMVPSYRPLDYGAKGFGHRGSPELWQSALRLPPDGNADPAPVTTEARMLESQFIRARSSTMASRRS